MRRSYEQGCGDMGQHSTQIRTARCNGQVIVWGTNLFGITFDKLVHHKNSMEYATHCILESWRYWHHHLGVYYRSGA